MIDRKIFGLIIICTLIVASPAFSLSVGYGDDFFFHVARLQSIAKADTFPALIYPEWFFDFGSPTGVFYPALFLYLPAMLYKFGLPLEITINLLSIETISLVAICSFVAFKKFFGNNRAAAIASVCYITQAYFLANVYQRFAIGEALGMAFLPLALVSSRCMLKDYSNDKNLWIIAVISYTGLIGSHILTTLLLILMLIAYCFWRVCIEKNLYFIDFKNLRNVFLVTLGLNAFFIVPFLEFYTSMKLQVAGTSDWFYEFAQWSPDFYVLNLLRAQTIAVIFFAFMIWRICRGQVNLDSKRQFLIGFWIFVVCAIMSTTIFPWKFLKHIPGHHLIELFQFPWRLMQLTGSFFYVMSFTIAVIELDKFLNRNLAPFICLTMAIYSVTIGGHCFLPGRSYSFDGWFAKKSVVFSDDERSAIVDSRSLHLWKDLDEWRKSDHDPRILDIKIENGMAEVFYDSPEEFSATLPIAFAYPLKVLRDNDFSDKEISQDLEACRIHFPAGSGSFKISVYRYDSYYEDYCYHGFGRLEIYNAKKFWDSGFEPRVLKIDHRNGKIFVNYDLSKSESNSKIELPIFYFPGHVANVPIESSERHLIQIDPSNLESHGTIEIFYEGLPSFKIANIISLATLIFILVKIRREGF